MIRAQARDANEELSDADLIDVVLNFLIAGRDTTAWSLLLPRTALLTHYRHSWLTWTLFELSERPGCSLPLTLLHFERIQTLQRWLRNCGPKSNRTLDLLRVAMTTAWTV